MVLQNFLETRGHLKPVNNIANFNIEPKKKPHNIQINNNAKQPKVRPNIKYSDAQRFRKYKTVTEPNLYNKIQVNEDDDIIEKIKAAFDPNYIKPKTNYSNEVTASAPYNKIPEQAQDGPTNIGSSKLRSKYDDLSNDELPKRMYDYGDISEREQKEIKEIEKKYNIKYSEDNDEELTRRAMIEYLEKRDERMAQINDISSKDYEELTFQAPEPSAEDIKFLESIKETHSTALHKSNDEDDDFDTFYNSDKEVDFPGSSPKLKKHIELTPSHLRTAKTPEQTVKELEAQLKRMSDNDSIKNTVKRLSMADTPKKYVSPLRKVETRGRPEGSLGVINRIKAEAERTDAEKIKHFKERKQVNALKHKPQMSYKELNYKNTMDHYHIENFMHS